MAETGLSLEQLALLHQVGGDAVAEPVQSWVRASALMKVSRAGVGANSQSPIGVGLGSAHESNW
jgi:hypothetical protein